jgi:PPOX class probable F420-dependent enzyme
MITAQAPAAMSSAVAAPVIPASHHDLFERSICAVLTTIAPDGQPRSSLDWVDQEAGEARFNTTLERLKGHDLVADPRCSLLVVDPENTARFVQVRGDAELITDGAIEHLDALTRRYTRHLWFYGFVYPKARQALETRVIGRIHARRITLDAIHA